MGESNRGNIAFNKIRLKNTRLNRKGEAPTLPTKPSTGSLKLPRRAMGVEALLETLVARRKPADRFKTPIAPGAPLILRGHIANHWEGFSVPPKIKRRFLDVTPEELKEWMRVLEAIRRD